MPSAKAKRDYYMRNRELVKERARLQRGTPRDQFLKRRSMLRQRYGITPEQYEAILAKQDGCCAICRSDGTRTVRSRYFDVDHCHATHRVRGLLCRMCNVMLGQIEKVHRSAELRASVSSYLGREA